MDPDELLGIHASTELAGDGDRSAMPRPRRFYVPELSAHIYQRGANKSTVFHDDTDRQRFLAIAREASLANDLDVHGFVLMSNHYHLVATPRTEKAMPNALHDLNGQYGAYYNRRYERIGPVWNARYGATALRDERYWLSCLRYIEYNPVKAELVTAPEEYLWSSHRVHAFGEASDWLRPHPLYLSLGRSPAERQQVYRAICACGA